MSDQEENANAQNIVDASEENDEASEAINIPVSSIEIPELDQAGDNAFAVEASSVGHETYVEEVRGQIDSSLYSNVERQSDQSVLLSYEGSDRLSYYQNQYVAEYENISPSDSQYSHSVVNMPIMDDIKSLKKSLKATMRDSVATVKIVLFPVGQEIIWPFKVDVAFKYLKDNFSNLLNIPPHILQLRHAGIILKDNGTLLQYGVKPEDTVQVEVFSTQPDQFPIKRIHGLSESSQIITVKIQTGTDEYQEVAVEIIKSDFHKPFLGGFRHKKTGIEYHNAGTQTVPKKIHQKTNVFSRDTQTVFQKKKQQQTRNTTSTQMTKIGVYVSNMTDKLVTPGNYISAEKYHAQRLAAIIIIQTYYRQWHAKRLVENLRRQIILRLKWEAKEEERKRREKEELMQMDFYRRHNPQTKEDFELLYNALELWRHEEIARINQCYTGAERKARLCDLLEKESQLIASIERHRYNAYMASKEAAIQAFLDKCSAPKTWKTASGSIVELDTQFTIRARELQTIFKCIMLRNISQDERLDVLLTLKHTMKEHDCKLTQEILELIDREVDLMMRGVKHHNLEGLRKRIATLLFHYIKTPLFNPEVARHLKVPQDPMEFYKKIYFCHSCQLYLPSTEFSVSSTSQRIYRCRNCVSLDNEARQRESFLKFKCLLKRLYYSEADYKDDSKIAFLMQLQDIRYLTEKIWASQSVLSAWNDLNDLVMVRWDKNVEWSPWNCILLTKDEAEVHLKLARTEEGYEPLFIHKIKHKHILAKNYFSQIPLLASFILDGGEVNEIRRYQTEKALQEPYL